MKFQSKFVNKKGLTIAETLIVAAISGVLAVGIAQVFSGFNKKKNQVEKNQNRLSEAILFVDQIKRDMKTAFDIVPGPTPNSFRLDAYTISGWATSVKSAQYSYEACPSSIPGNCLKRNFASLITYFQIENFEFCVQSKPPSEPSSNFWCAPTGSIASSFLATAALKKRLLIRFNMPNALIESQTSKPLILVFNLEGRTMDGSAPRGDFVLVNK
jgi:type II secretory pathway pseudopilin PulG